MQKAEFKRYREMLLKKKEELLSSSLVKKMQIEGGDNSRKGDWIDQSSEDNDIYINLHLRQTDTKVLRAIEDALQRIENKSFGTCSSCGEPISTARLNAVPWSRVCLPCKEKQDAGK